MNKYALMAFGGIFLNFATVKAADTTPQGATILTDSAKKTDTTVCVQPSKNDVKKKRKSPECGGMYGGLGVYHQDFTDMNAIFGRHGFNALNKDLTMFTFGFFGMTDRNRGGLDFEFTWSDKASATVDTGAIASIAVHGFDISFKGMFDLVDRPHWGVGPVYQIGYYSQTYEFKSRNVSFDDLFSGSPNQKIQLSYSGLSLTAGLNFHIKTRMDKEFEENGALHTPMAGLNAEAGVHFYPIRKTSDEVDNVPSMARYGLYGKIFIDLGEKMKRLPNRKND